MNVIKSNCTDAALNSAIAEQFLDWGKSLTKEYTDNSLWGDRHWAKSADAVLPLMEKWNVIRWCPKDKCLSIWPSATTSESFDVKASTFARACCFALLKAKGWTVEDTP